MHFATNFVTAATMQVEQHDCIEWCADMPDARLCFDVPGEYQQHSSSHLHLTLWLRAGWV